MKLSTTFNLLAYIVVFSSIALANYLKVLNFGYAMGSITWAIAITLVAISSEAKKIEKKWRTK